jgi:ADP-ribose pyrophosphatase YjhB (NUDIX family)
MTCKLVADVAVVAGDHVLLVRYRDTSKYDGEAGWFLPDDNLQRLEHPDDAARRIVDEQVGVHGVDVTLAEIESFDGGAWHLVFHYVAALAEPVEVAAAGNVAETKWCPLGELPDPSEIAHHGWALDVLSRVVAVPGAG